MKDNLIITISRQYGAGGMEVGQKLSERLGIPCYDKELPKKAAEKSHIPEKFFLDYDEKIIRGLYFFGAADIDSMYLPQNQDLFRAQTDAIREIAETESCIFIGRCADLMLKDFPNCINVFLHSSKEFRLERLVNKYGVPQSDAESALTRVDKQRQRHHSIFSDKKWNDISIYHLALETSKLGIDNTVDIIVNYLELYNKK